MSEDFSKKLRVNVRQEQMPTPVFANHIESVGANQLVTLTFYASLLPRGFRAPEDVPDEIEARPVAQVVVPEQVWGDLISALIARREEAAKAQQEG